MKPKWQRAQFVYAGICPEVLGREVWAQSDSVSDNICGCVWPMDCAKRSILIHTIDPTGKQDCLHLDCIELLARDENDFAEDVPLIPWTKFLASCKENNGQRS